MDRNRLTVQWHLQIDQCWKNNQMQNKQIKATSLWLREGLGEAWPAFQLHTNLLSCQPAFATHVINSGSDFPPATWPPCEELVTPGVALLQPETELTCPKSSRQHKPRTALCALCSEAVPGLVGKDRASTSKSSSDGPHGLWPKKVKTNPQQP